MDYHGHCISISVIYLSSNGMLVTKYTKLKVNLSTEYFYLNNAVVNLWRTQDVQARINRGGFKS